MVVEPRNSTQRTTQPSRNPIVIVLLLVLVLDCPISDDENEDDDEDERFARPGTIWADTDTKDGGGVYPRSTKNSSLRTVLARCPPYRRLFAENFHSIEIADQILVRHSREDRIHSLRERH